MGVEADDVFDRAQRRADDLVSGRIRPPVTIEPCSCGHRSCKDFWLVGVGKFVQGAGFTRDEAQRIADLLNDADLA